MTQVTPSAAQSASVLQLGGRPVLVVQIGVPVPPPLPLPVLVHVVPAGQLPGATTGHPVQAPSFPPVQTATPRAPLGH